MHKIFTTRDDCPCCGSKNIVRLLDKPFSDKSISEFVTKFYQNRVPPEVLTNGFYRITKCKECSCIYQEDILSDFYMEKLYETWINPQESFLKKKNADSNLFMQYSLENLKISKLFNMKPSLINVLDFGMGWGHWLLMAKAFGYNVTGVELSNERINFAKSSGINVVKSTEVLENETFDYIYCNQSFEHIPFPQSALCELSRLLKPNGVIHLQFPPRKNFEKLIKNKNWKANKNCLQPLEHINSFNRKTMDKMAEKANLKIFSLPLVTYQQPIIALFKKVALYFLPTNSLSCVFLKK